MVTALLTRGRGVRRGEASAELPRSGVDGPSAAIGPLAGVGLGARVEAAAGGTNEPPDPMSP